MKIKSIEIKGIGGIENLYIEFNANMNLICGPNGIGKTTILECIAHSFSLSSTNILKRSASSDGGSGSFCATIEVDGVDKRTNITISNFTPENDSNIHGMYDKSENLLSLKVNRTFNYQPLNAVGKDPTKNNNTSLQEAKSGINLNEVKNWFVNRYLYSAHEGALTNEQLNNLELAKKSFSLLNPEFRFTKVVASSNEIMIESPRGEIYYEYLSSGFKSCLSIIFGIIKEIELRFKDPTIKADKFDGIILIDELELHLHPEWQAKIANILIEVFPSAQFITSTHSPHILQNAKPNEIIALASDGANTYRRNIADGAYGFQGWTVEEVLTDVMGMSDTRTETYKSKISEFETAIGSENYSAAKIAFDELDKLLHPENHLRKLLKLDLASIKEAGE